MKTSVPVIGLLLLCIAGVVSSLPAAETHYLKTPSFRLGIDSQSGLPCFWGIGQSGSQWIGKNIMAEDVLAELTAPGGCRRISVVEKSESGVTTLWQMGRESVPVKLAYEKTGSAVRIVCSRSEDGGTSIPVSFKIPFNPFVTATTFLSSARNDAGDFVLPGVLVAPDHGALQFTPSPSEDTPVKAAMVGSRGDHRMALLIQFELTSGDEIAFEISGFDVPRIAGVSREYSDIVHHAWLNLFQTRAVNDTTLVPGPFPDMYRIPQLIANNTLSDPVSFTYFTAADMAFLTPGTPSLSLMEIIKHSVTYWLENKIPPEGSAIGYWEHTKFLDSNPSLLICAWDIFAYTRDMEWLKKHIRILEVLANYLASRDLDGDGIVEAEMEGTKGRLANTGRDRSSNWMDAVNFGYKDAFVNAFIYRAWRCLADLEEQMGNTSLARLYESLAARLKEQYFQTFYDHSTGMIAGWVDADGRMAPYRFPNVTGLAVACGVISGKRAYEVMANTIHAIRETGFSNFKYGGVPLTLDPIEPFDYLFRGFGYPDPKLPDKNWQVYQNGGISPTQSAYYLQGLIGAGFKNEAEEILSAMLKTQKTGGFQNGIINEYPKGAEWKTWEGKPGGYEGFLNDNYYYLIAAPLMDDAVYRRLFAPTFGE